MSEMEINGELIVYNLGRSGFSAQSISGNVSTGTYFITSLFF
jgi:hypothetical protein